MFGRIMNNYYYGKSGKGDFRKEDMPETRMQLFRDTLRTRFGSLFRLNLLYMLIWIPAMIVIFLHCGQIYNDLNNYYIVKNENYAYVVEQAEASGQTVTVTEEEFNALKENDVDLSSYLYGRIFFMLLWLAPCIAITGPFTAGLSYVTRNWARDEHAFVWADFKDAVKANWKYSLVISLITGILPLAIYQGWITYGAMANTNAILVIPKVLIVVVGVIWALCVTYMYPLTVTYTLKLKDVLRNGFLLGIARLPFSVGIRLLHCVPSLIAAAAVWFFGLDPLLALVILGAYYILVGFALSRFVTASYTNAVFDRFINSRIEGAKVNQGIRPREEDEDDPDEEESDNLPDTGKE